MLPLAVAFLLFAGLLSASVYSGIRACDGHFGYPLDDTYIHMAMAKNFALHGVWGVTRYAFSSSTSSPLFTLLLAGCYAVTGVHEVTPFILNCIFGVFVIIWCNLALMQRSVAARARVAFLSLLILAIPLSTLVLVGMEHVLHTLLTLIFAHLCCVLVASSAEMPRFELTALLLVAPLLVTARYESVFLIAIACLLFLFHGAWKLAIGLLSVSAIPVATYGYLSVMNGWYAIPSSLLLKANLPTGSNSGMFGSFSRTLLINGTQGFHLVALTLIAIVLLYFGQQRFKTIWLYSQTGLILFIFSAMLHLGLARVGWFFRYESYLIGFGMVVSAIALYELGMPKSVRGAILLYTPLFLFALPISYRFVHATFRAPQAISDIYCQQYQMGLFARDNFHGQTIVVADIGAVSFLSNARVLDLIGLGSLESLSARLHKTYSTDWLDGWSRREGATAALTAIPNPPSTWTLISTWTIPNNYISGSNHVSVYAIDPACRNVLADEVDRFGSRLPARVIRQPAVASNRIGLIFPEVKGLDLEFRLPKNFK